MYSVQERIEKQSGLVISLIPCVSISILERIESEKAETQWSIKQEAEGNHFDDSHGEKKIIVSSVSLDLWKEK